MRVFAADPLSLDTRSLQPADRRKLKEELKVVSCAGRIRHGHGCRKTGSLTMQCWFVTALLTILTASKASHMTTTQSSNPETEAQKEDDERKRRRGKGSRRKKARSFPRQHGLQTPGPNRQKKAQKGVRVAKKQKEEERLEVEDALENKHKCGERESERASQEEEEVDDEEVQRRCWGGYLCLRTLAEFGF